MHVDSPLAPSAAQPHRALVLAACMLAMFMSAIEATIVATAMPSIIGELGGFHLFSWVFSLYLLAQAVTIPVYGKLADLYGRRPALFAGATLFLVGSVLAGFATSMHMLIACRGLQGIGAGALMPVAATVVADVYPGAERGRVQGWLSSVWGISAVTGPALGALLVEHFGWPLVFWLNLPVGLLAMTLMGLFLREDVERHAVAIDLAGAALMMAGTAALMLLLLQGLTMDRSTLAGLGLLVAVCAVVFLRVERRAPSPVMPLALWRNRVIATGNLGQLAAGAVMIGVTSFVPAYVQGVMGRSPLEAGFALTAMSIGWPLAATLSGRMMARVPFRLTAFGGGVSLLAGCLVLYSLDPSRAAPYAGLGAFLVGFGMGFCNTTFVV
ncbi:MAG: MFS transporter, partial [Planctomycetes bacterium]|nr:MFS transporter [Planctomycetota bacterium]